MKSGKSPLDKSQTEGKPCLCIRWFETFMEPVAMLNMRDDRLHKKIDIDHHPLYKKYI
jgi:hypothetical protein